MDKGLPDANTDYPTLHRSLDNLESRSGGITPNINGLAPCMGRIAATSLGDVPLTGTISAVKDKRDACFLPYLVKQVKEAPVHILNGTRRDASLELSGGEILTHCRGFHLPIPLPVPQTPRERPSSPRLPHGQTQEQSRHSRNKWCE